MVSFGEDVRVTGAVAYVGLRAASINRIDHPGHRSRPARASSRLAIIRLTMISWDQAVCR